MSFISSNRKLPNLVDVETSDRYLAYLKIKMHFVSLKRVRGNTMCSLILLYKTLGDETVRLTPEGKISIKFVFTTIALYGA